MQEQAQGHKRSREDGTEQQLQLTDVEGDTNMSIAGIVAAIRDKIDEPYVDLTGERWALKKFPEDELRKRRSLEVDSLIKFNTFVRGTR